MNRLVNRFLNATITLAVLAIFLLVAGSAAFAEEIEVPFTICAYRHVILLTLQVNGHPRTFMVDTGANQSVVSPEAAGLSTAELHTANFTTAGAGYHGEAMWQELDLALGHRKWNRRPTVVMDLSAASRAFDEKIDGLLGEDFLAEFSEVTIDFKAKVIRLKK